MLRKNVLNYFLQFFFILQECVVDKKKKFSNVLPNYNYYVSTFQSIDLKTN